MQDDIIISNENLINETIIHINDIKDIIDRKLIQLIENLPFNNLKPYFEYTLLTPGKRLRPILTVLSAQTLDGKIENVLALALAFEILHTTTLTHDDIIDDDKIRRGKLTVHEKWSKNDAILIGDALFSAAISLIAEYEKKIIKTAALYGMQLCSGELMNLVLSQTEMNETKYFEKIKSKSAALFRACTQCGAMVAKGSSEEIHALAKYGEYFGISYQLKDDLEDITDKDNILLDMRKGRITLPLTYLYQHGDNETRKLIEIYLGKDNLPHNIIEKIMEELEKTGAIKYCKEKIEENIKLGINSLNKIKDSIYKQCLIEMITNIK